MDHPTQHLGDQEPDAEVVVVPGGTSGNGNGHGNGHGNSRLQTSAEDSPGRSEKYGRDFAGDFSSSHSSSQWPMEEKLPSFFGRSQPYKLLCGIGIAPIRAIVWPTMSRLQPLEQQQRKQHFKH